MTWTGVLIKRPRKRSGDDFIGWAISGVHAGIFTHAEEANLANVQFKREENHACVWRIEISHALANMCYGIAFTAIANLDISTSK